MSISERIKAFFKEDKAIPYSTMKQRARILVIDDREFTYLDLFIKDGYSIEKWSSIESLPKLEENYYDIILLDQQGIGIEQSPIKNGMALLKHLKNYNPAQIVIAYSQSKFKIGDLEFFNLSDASLDKNSDYYIFKRLVDDLLKKRFSTEYYAQQLKKFLEKQNENVSEAEIQQVYQHIKKNKLSRAEKLISSLKLATETAKTCLNVISICTKIQGSL